MNDLPNPPPPPPDDERAVPARVWGGAALLSAARVWGSVCTAAILIVLARYLPGAEFGRYTFYLAIFLLLDGLCDFGTGAAAVQRSAHDPRLLPGAIAAGRRIRAGTAGLCFALVALPAWLLEERGWTWVGLAALYPFSRLPELSAVVYHREIRWNVPVAMRAATGTARLALALGLWRGGVESFGPYLVAHLGTLAAGNVALYFLARRRLPRPEGKVSPMRGMLLAAVPLGLAGVCQQAYFYVDNLFVRGLRGDVELGQYNAAVRILGFLVMISAHATVAALPWLARRHRRGELGDATRRLALPLFSAACLVLGAMWPWSEQILVAIFGADFAPAAPSLRWLLVAAAVIYAGAGWLTAVVASGAMRTVLVITAGALLANVAGNAWLVPSRGMEGAAIATLATELLVTFGALAALVRARARPLERPALWLAGPVLFLAAAWLSGTLG